MVCGREYPQSVQQQLAAANVASIAKKDRFGMATSHFRTGGHCLDV
jgi:hypothetical protein